MWPDRLSFAIITSALIVVGILFYYVLTAPLLLYLPARTPVRTVVWSAMAVLFAAGVIGGFSNRRLALSVGVGIGLLVAELATEQGFSDIHYGATAFWLTIRNPIFWGWFFMAWLLGAACGFALVRISSRKQTRETS